MSKIVDKAKELLGKHEDKVDSGLDKAGEQADRRTDQKYTGHIDKGVQAAKDHTGEGETNR
ncbi:antitoxin [Dactylosporangium sp. NPDC049525]|uniref:antitoxin n=1 Tax=Dactylosporangium sp. NPDC049525 TaxID=3154730 RepID=UPI003432C014